MRRDPGNAAAPLTAAGRASRGGMTTEMTAERCPLFSLPLTEGTLHLRTVQSELGEGELPNTFVAPPTYFTGPSSTLPRFSPLEIACSPFLSHSSFSTLCLLLVAFSSAPVDYPIPWRFHGERSSPRGYRSFSLFAYFQDFCGVCRLIISQTLQYRLRRLWS